jgi:hypothetical protein
MGLTRQTGRRRSEHRNGHQVINRTSVHYAGAVPRPAPGFHEPGPCLPALSQAARYPDDVRRTWKPLIRQRQWFNLRPQRLSRPGEWARRKRKKQGEGEMTGAQAEPDGNGDVAGDLPDPLTP